MDLKIQDFANRCFVYLSYPILTLLFFWWAFSLIQCFRSRINKSHITAAVVAIVAASCIFLSHTCEFKTNSDEANLMSVSRSLFMFKKPQNILDSKFYFGNLYPITFEIPKRPLMFPYMIHLIHSVIGCRIESVFVLNFMVLATLLFFVFTISRKRLGGAAVAYAGVFTVLSHPVVNIFATSGGFDLISSLLLLISILFAYEYTFEERKDLLPALISTLLVFSNIRYENPVIAAVILVSIFFFGHKSMRDLKTKATTGYLAAGAVFMIPQICQRIIMPNHQENPDNVAAFSIPHVWENLGILVRGLFRFDLPYDNLILLLSFPALIILFFRPRVRLSLIFFLLPLLAQFSFYLPYWFGKFDHPAAARLFILFALYSSGICIWAYSKWIKPTSLVVISAALMAIYLPVGIDNKFMNNLTLNRDIRYIERFVHEHDANNDHRLLIIYDRPVQLSALGYGGVSLDYAKSHLGDIQLEKTRGLYDHVYLFESTVYGDEEKTWGATSKAFKYVQRFQQFDNNVMQIYELN